MNAMGVKRPVPFLVRRGAPPTWRETGLDGNGTTSVVVLFDSKAVFFFFSFRYVSLNEKRGSILRLM